jgi:S1-C subfamily serine protease
MNTKIFFTLCLLFFFFSLQAIESNAAEKKVTNKEIGIQVSTITEEYMQYLKLDNTKGVIVLGVLPGSPADNGGMHPGDVILGIAEFPISNIEEYEEAVKKLEGRGDFSIMIRDREGPFSYIQIIKHE